jgi:hypothetical protein
MLVSICDEALIFTEIKHSVSEHHYILSMKAEFSFILDLVVCV